MAVILASIKYGPLLSFEQLARRQKRNATLELAELRAELRAKQREIGELRSLLRISQRRNTELQRQVERDFRASERARKREIAAFKRFAKGAKIRVKRQGHGLAKQIGQYRPALQQYRMRHRRSKYFVRLHSNLDAQILAYSDKIQAMNDWRAKHGMAYVENARELFLALPREAQLSILREVEALNGERKVERRYDPLFAYH